jgi:hypothetical protein
MKLEINQGYTTMHGQPIIKIFQGGCLGYTADVILTVNNMPINGGLTESNSRKAQI